MRRRAAVLALVVGAAALSCVQYTLPPIVAQRERAIADLALRDYRRNPEAPSPYARAVYCLAEETADSYGDGGVDAGGLIVCKPPPPPKPIVADPRVMCVDGFSCVGGHCFCAWDIDAGR